MRVRAGSQDLAKSRFDVRIVIRILLILIAIGPGLIYARAYMTMFAIPGDLEPFSDTQTYLAAGERLNAGHDLYRLRPGDRPVLVDQVGFFAPLISPPPIAVLWRPLAALPFGAALWIAACWVALLGTVAFLVFRVGIVAVILSVLLAEPIGNQLALGNVASFFPALTVLVWNLRASRWSGSLIGVMAALKLSPGALFAARHISRSPAQLVAGALAIAAMFGIGILGSSVGALVDYVAVAAGTKPSIHSLSGLLGVPWLSFAVLLLGCGAALLIRNQRLSFAIALMASVLGNPALYIPGYVPLLALAALATGTKAVWPRDSSVPPVGHDGLRAYHPERGMVDAH